MNDFIRNLKTTILCKNWATLKKLEYEYKNPEGKWETQVREAYDRGDGATILLFNSLTGKILLTRQFRIPTYLNGNETGLMIETCAGKMDEKDPDKCILREVEEETGYRLPSVQRIFSAYMSPGSVTENIYFYTGEYRDEYRVSSGGGKESEQENIEVLEMTLEEAHQMIQSGQICDGKTIMLIQYALLNNLLGDKR